MSGKIIGYVRVSTHEQSEERQLVEQQLDKVFLDKVSGKSTERPALQELLNYAREGDIILVHSMDRLARNLDDLRRLVKDLTSRQIKIRFIKENLEFSGEDSPMSTLLLSVMGAFAEFERALIRERQREGIELAKKKGVYKGRKRALSDAHYDFIKMALEQGHSKLTIAKELKVDPSTLYRYLKAHDLLPKLAANPEDLQNLRQNFSQSAPS